MQGVWNTGGTLDYLGLRWLILDNNLLEKRTRLCIRKYIPPLLHVQRVQQTELMRHEGSEEFAFYFVGFASPASIRHYICQCGLLYKPFTTSLGSKYQSTCRGQSSGPWTQVCIYATENLVPPIQFEVTDCCHLPEPEHSDSLSQAAHCRHKYSHVLWSPSSSSLELKLSSVLDHWHLKLTKAVNRK